MSKSSSNIDPIKERPLEEIQLPKNDEISINYVHKGEILNWNKIVINDIFAFKVVFGITRSNDKIKPQTIKECRHRNDWSIWKEVI